MKSTQMTSDLIYRVLRSPEPLRAVVQAMAHEAKTSGASHPMAITELFLELLYASTLPAEPEDQREAIAALIMALEDFNDAL